jgi:hypothetical protein
VLEYLGKLSGFFHRSAKRTKFLERAIEAAGLSSKKTRIPTLSDTRWMARHAVVESVKDLLPAIIATLAQLRNDEAAVTDSAFLLHFLNETEFVFSFVLLDTVMEALKPLTLIFQSAHVDIYNVLIDSYQILIINQRLKAQRAIDLFVRTVEQWKDGVGTGSFERCKSAAEQMLNTVKESGYQRRSTRQVQDISFDDCFELHTKFLNSIR